MDNKSIEQRLKTLSKLKEKVKNDIEFEKKSLKSDFGDKSGLFAPLPSFN